MQKQIQNMEYNELLDEVTESGDQEITERRKKLIKKGIVVTLVYHCQRCNYIWISKDFDAFFDEISRRIS